MTADPVAPASAERSVAVRIRSLLPSLAPAERRVAEAVLSDLAAAASRPIGSLATAANTSETTVVRFCRAVGVGGYPELRLRLAAEAGRAASSGHDGRIVGSDIGPGDDLAEVVEKVSFADARAIEETAAQLDLATLEAVVDALVAAERIELFGVGASAFVAADFQQKLRRIARLAFVSTDAHAALTSAALLGPADVAVGFSHTGATLDTVEPLHEARERGARTVAVTNFPRSPIAEVAELVLTTAARETTFRSGAMASRLAQLTVVDCLFVAVAQRTYSGTLDALERTYAAVRHRRSNKGKRS